MIHSPSRNPPDDQREWTQTLVTILSPAQINPSPDEEVDLRDYNNARRDANGRTKDKKESNGRVDWNGSPHVHPLARRNTNPRSAQRHHSGAIWRHLLSSAVYMDLKREEERGDTEDVGAKQRTKGENGGGCSKIVAFRTMEVGLGERDMWRRKAVTPLMMSNAAGGHSNGARGGRGAGNTNMDWDGLECAPRQFEYLCEVHRHIDVEAECTQGAKSRVGDKASEHDTEDVQIRRRFVRVDCMGLSGVLFYELAVASPTMQCDDHPSHFMSNFASNTSTRPSSRHRQLKPPLLTLESVFGDLDDPKSPSMHVDDLLDAVKAKVCYFPAYACTSFIAGQAIVAFYRDKPELRPLPCADGFSVIYPSPSALSSKAPKSNAGHSKGVPFATEWGAPAPSWKDGSETAPFLGDPCKGSASSMALNLDEEDPYRMLMVRSCSHPTVGWSGMEKVMAYGNIGQVSAEELDQVKEKDDAKRDSGYGSITGVLELGDSSVFEGGNTGAEGTGDLMVDTIPHLRPSDPVTLRCRQSEKMEILPNGTETISSDRSKPRSKAKGHLTKFASLASITNVSATRVRSSFSKPFGIAASMPAISVIMPGISTVSNISMYDTFASFLDFMEPDDHEGNGEEIVDVEKGLHVV